MILGFMFRLMIHFGLISVYGVRYKSKFFCVCVCVYARTRAHVDFPLFQHYLLKTIFSLLNFLCIFMEDQLCGSISSSPFHSANLFMYLNSNLTLSLL